MNPLVVIGSQSVRRRLAAYALEYAGKELLKRVAELNNFRNDRSLEYSESVESLDRIGVDLDLLAQLAKGDFNVLVEMCQEVLSSEMKTEALPYAVPVPGFPGIPDDALRYYTSFTTYVDYINTLSATLNEYRVIVGSDSVYKDGAPLSYIRVPSCAYASNRNVLVHHFHDGGLFRDKVVAKTFPNFDETVVRSVKCLEPITDERVSCDIRGVTFSGSKESFPGVKVHERTTNSFYSIPSRAFMFLKKNDKLREGYKLKKEISYLSANGVVLINFLCHIYQKSVS